MMFTTHAQKRRFCCWQSMWQDSCTTLFKEVQNTQGRSDPDSRKKNSPNKCPFPLEHQLGIQLAKKQWQHWSAEKYLVRPHQPVKWKLSLREMAKWNAFFPFSSSVVSDWLQFEGNEKRYVIYILMCMHWARDRVKLWLPNAPCFELSLHHSMIPSTSSNLMHSLLCCR